MRSSSAVMGPAGTRLLVGASAVVVLLIGQGARALAVEGPIPTATEDSGSSPTPTDDEPIPTATVFPRCDFDPVPASGPPGTRLVLEGICYPIHSGRQGFIFFDDTQFAAPRGDTPGSYKVIYTVPAGTAVGTHQLEFRLSPEGGAIASAPFEVTGGLLAGLCEFDPIPAGGPPGTKVSFDGYCYPIHSGRPGYVEFDDIEIGSFHGDTIALYSFGFIIPDGTLPGPHEFRFRDRAGGVLFAAAVFTVSERLDFCRGDCNRDGNVGVGEVVTGVDLALGEGDVGDCDRSDVNADGVVGVDELVAGARAKLYGCPRACKSPNDCASLCYEPAAVPCSGACRVIQNQCLSDADCDWRGGKACVTVREEACACYDTNLCRRLCNSDDDCGAGESCDAGHCVAAPCADSPCESNFTCDLDEKVCRRSVCTEDSDCGGGVCVTLRCYDAPGVCGP